MNIFENYDEDGYENKRFLHCSDSNKLNHRIKYTGQPVSGYGFNNNYFLVSLLIIFDKLSL